VLFDTITALATTSVTDHLVEVSARAPSSNPQFNCLLVTRCDMPLHTIVCMSEVPGGR
jgi:hypothetical protein